MREYITDAEDMLPALRAQDEREAGVLTLVKRDSIESMHRDFGVEPESIARELNLDIGDVLAVIEALDHSSSPRPW